MKVLESVQAISKDVSGILDHFIAEKIEQFKAREFGLTTEVLEFVRLYCASEKTHPRPMLVLVGYEASGKKRDKEILETSIFTTLFTKYLAVHDDIIDQDEIKNGEPTIHMRARQFNNDPKMGNDFALLAGEFLWSWSLEVLRNSSYPESAKAKAIENVLWTNEQTNVGQILDLDFVMRPISDLSEQEIWKMYVLKAALYCYSLPLTVGAQLAELPDDIVMKLRIFGELVGSASQLRDDLEGALGDTEETGKSNIVDLRMGVKSLLILRAYQQAGNGDKEFLNEYYGNPGLDEVHAKQIREIISRTDAEKYCHDGIVQNANKARRIVAELTPILSQDSLDYLEDLIQFRLRA